MIAAHTAVEYLAAGVKEAVEDTRFKMSLADHRKFRDLCNEIENMADEAGRESLKIPAQLPVRGNMQQAKIAVSIKSKIDGK